MSNLTVRDSTPDDMPTVQSIYAAEVLNGLATFEEVPPSVAELSARRVAVLSLRLPYLVAEIDGQVVGYCYAGHHRSRPAYRNTLENSVYVAPEARGLGVGRALLSELVARCGAGGWRQMIAVIGDSNNAGSIGLHARLGFRDAGTLRSVGFKHGRWVDTVLMQLPLGAGDETLPATVDET